MSFLGALISCWDICKHNCTVGTSVASGFYETYVLGTDRVATDQYTLTNLPPEPYRNKHQIETTYVDQYGGRSYSVRVGVTSLEDKLVDSFLGLPFAILESLFFLLCGVVNAGISLIAALFLVLVVAVFPFLLFTDPLLELTLTAGSLAVFGAALFGAAVCLFWAVYYPLKALAKIPVGIFLGVEALVNLALGRSINPPTIQEIDRLDSDAIDHLEIAVKSVKSLKNEFEHALEQIKFSDDVLPDRYKCKISLSIMRPVLLSDGRIYDQDQATKILETNPVSAIDRAPLRSEQLVLPGYYAEIKALVDALTAEYHRAKTKGQAPEYREILAYAEKNSAVATGLHEALSVCVSGILKAKDTTDASTLLSVTVNMSGNRSYQFIPTTPVIQAALQVIAPIVGGANLNNSMSDQESIGIFIELLKRHENFRTLFVTALTETLLAEQQWAQGFGQLSAQAGPVNTQPPSLLAQINPLMSSAFDEFWPDPVSSVTSNNSSSAPNYRQN